MIWDTIEKRWQQFLNLMRSWESNPTKQNSNPAAGEGNEAVLRMQDYRDEPNDFYGHGRVG
jgi:hypothetical protein